ncbi:AraC family transcriptional regulator [Sphingobacterium sp. SRCM116780]|uniref:helix-turn-helix domain-containing protein n=1 Tax=Sphingobacterium sp. SRCM116780 TaxID=2907623 RepID=UPI001F32C884|nr:AraC family transcriptional regulator [Sphingobacterium sp. SRCM116780]UIR57883.1 AraC family transcriptional regulator [Sphingobacterium sp. SRCM116780]
MLFRFPPPAPIINDSTFLSSGSETFAKLKIEFKAGKRTVFMTEHTLIFVISGIKLLHFSDQTLKITPGQVVLLKKGIYVMAEYIEEGLAFEALLIFLPENILKSFIPKSNKYIGLNKSDPYIVFPINMLIQDFKIQFRQYFEHPLFNYEQLIPLKQKEILILLLSSGYKEQALAFIDAAVSKNVQDMDAIIQEYMLHPITIAELASLCNRSLATFKRDFQKQYHTSPRVYINKHRLNHAKMLLENTDKQISEISTDCAFESTSYFIRIFKQEFGITPQRMRAKITIE